MESKKSLEKGVKIKAIAVGAACATAVGCFFGGYLIYKAYYAPGWHEKDSKLYYISEDTKENAVGLYQIDGSTYLFDSDGYMLTGWQTYKGDTYYFNSDGVMQKGKTTIDGTEYYFSPDSGIFYTGTVTLYGISYYFNQYGFTDDGFITVDGVEREYVLEHAIYADIALIKAYKADTLGNLIYYKSARNFNPAMAMAAKYTIAQVDEIVEPGELDPEAIVTPHLFVNAVVLGGEK